VRTNLLALATGSAPGVDADAVTPGVIGFVLTFVVAAATVLLVLDMVRRIRRVRYREQVREQLAAEQADGATPAPED
jgi:hypothetical protein